MTKGPESHLQDFAQCLQLPNLSQQDCISRIRARSLETYYCGNRDPPALMSPPMACCSAPGSQSFKMSLMLLANPKDSQNSSVFGAREVRQTSELVVSQGERFTWCRALCPLPTFGVSSELCARRPCARRPCTRRAHPPGLDFAHEKLLLAILGEWESPWLHNQKVYNSNQES